MYDDLLDPRIIRLPEFAPGEWLNADQPLSKQSLRGRVVLVDFWDYSCVNCVRTLPYLVRWYERYAVHGLVIIGIHSPEFAFGQIQQQVKTAVIHHHIPYPILLDNDYQNWERFANKAWPTKYLIDPDGYIRYRWQGEGHYQETERAIQALLRQQNPGITLPDPLPLLREEDTPGAVCYRPTPELYAGYRGGGLFGGALGNPAGYLPDTAVFYDLPEPKTRQPGLFYVEGLWRAWPEALAFAGQSGGKVVLRYQAVTVNAVLSPTADAVALRLGLAVGRGGRVVVQQDGRYLDPSNAGSDIQISANGISFVQINRPHMMQLVRNPFYEQHELTLIFQSPEMALYTFTFTTCVMPQAQHHNS